jgi:antirestriction protein ArdC
MLCGVAGIDNSTIDNSASYINSWLRKLKDDKTLIVQAAAKAQKAADYILGTTFEEAAE